MRRALVGSVLVLGLMCACSSGKPDSPAATSYTPPISQTQIQSLVYPLMRQDVSALADKDDATLNRVGVQQCTELAKEDLAEAYLLLLKGDLLAGIPAREAGALIAYAVRGWCPDQQYKLPAS